MNLTIRPMTQAERNYCYSWSSHLMAAAGCIGHLRGDMGREGNGFYTTWFDHQEDLKTQEFKTELDAVVNALRFDLSYGGVLSRRGTLDAYCRANPGSRIGRDGREYGFRLDTEDYVYMLRLNPNRGEYNFYIYCYVREQLDDHMAEAERGIRFVDSHYGAERAVAALEGLGAASRCAAALLVMDPSAIPNIGSFTQEERQRLFSFHRNLALDAAQKVFQGIGFTILPSRPGGMEVFFLWGLEDARPIALFHTRLTAAFQDISQMKISVLGTAVLSGRELAQLRTQLECLKRAYAISPQPFLCYARSMGKGDYVAAAKRYVDAHILERVLVQDVAAAIGITPNYLSSLFKRQLGQNFMDYVNATKVKYACTLLRGGKHMVYEVSHMLGYDNAYYFTKVFKRYMNMTPTEYQAESARE